MNHGDSDIARAVDYLKEHSGAFPTIAIVAGSGLGAIAGQIDDALAIDYEVIPGFPPATVAGHAGRLLAGPMAGKRVAIFCGRKHLYEGASVEEATFAVRLMSRLGVKALILSNAAGGVSPRLRAGDLMLIVDHINIANRTFFRFKEATFTRNTKAVSCYSLRLASLARAASQREGIPLLEGVYCVNLGPAYETRAEARFARWAGADAVGMSTVPEAIEAAGLGMETLAISCITNSYAHGRGATTHEDVIAAAARAEDRFARLVKSIVDEL